MVGRYLPNVLVTIQLAGLATIVDLVFGFPFAYILVRKVRYRNVVRALMVFPMFGALYIAFGMRFILLPGGPAAPLLSALGISSTRLLYSLPSVVFAMSIFTFPFMVMSIGTALSQRRPDARGGRGLPGRAAVADVPAGRPAAYPVRASSRVPHGVRLEHRRVRRAGAARLAQRAAVARLDALPAGRGADRLRARVRDGHRAAGDRVRRHVLLAALLARGARRMTAGVHGNPPRAPRRGVRARRDQRRAGRRCPQPRLHLVLPVVFVLPFRRCWSTRSPGRRDVRRRELPVRRSAASARTSAGASRSRPDAR